MPKIEAYWAQYQIAIDKEDKAEEADNPRRTPRCVLEKKGLILTKLKIQAVVPHARLLQVRFHPFRKKRLVATSKISVGATVGVFEEGEYLENELVQGVVHKCSAESLILLAYSRDLPRLSLLLKMSNLVVAASTIELVAGRRRAAIGGVLYAYKQPEDRAHVLSRVVFDKLSESRLIDTRPLYQILSRSTGKQAFQPQTYLDTALSNEDDGENYEEESGNHKSRVSLFERITENDTDYIRDVLPTLNLSQATAIANCFRVAACHCIHGPPGTGKTRTLAGLIKLLTKGGKKVLAAAPSNMAVDNLMKAVHAEGVGRTIRVGHPGRISKELWKWALDIMSPDVGETECEEARQQMLINASVIFCTCTTAGGLKSFLNFDVVVIDEAGQALEVDCWIPALRGAKLLLAGDNQQLPPTVKTNDPLLLQTLFERLLPYSSSLLDVQYRMRPGILAWSNAEFYGGKLKSSGSVVDERSFPATRWVDTAGCNYREEISSKDKSRSNPLEAATVIGYLKQLKKEMKGDANFMTDKVVVITPYRGQVQLIKAFAQSVKGLKDLRVMTVDGFQGQETEVAIISCVRSNKKKQLGFLSDWRRLNVAVTRAKQHVCLMGDSETVSVGDTPISRLFREVQSNGEVVSAVGYLDVNIIPTWLRRKHETLQANSKSKPAPAQGTPDPRKEERRPRQEKNVDTPHDSKKQGGKNDANAFKKQGGKPDAFRKQGGKRDPNAGKRQGGNAETSAQSSDFRRVQKQIRGIRGSGKSEIVFEGLSAMHRKFVHELAEKLNLQHFSKTDDKGARRITVALPKKKENLSESNNTSQSLKNTIERSDSQQHLPPKRAARKKKAPAAVNPDKEDQQNSAKG